MRTANHILLVDDEVALCKAASRLLREEGYRVETCQTAKEGLEKFTREGADLLITDLVLPDSNGIEVLKQAKAIHPTVEVLVITGHGTIERAVEAIRFGAYDFIEKPLDGNLLLHAVRKAIEKHRLTLENLELRAHLGRQTAEEALIGHCPAILEVKKLIRQIAPTDVSVLIQGESGTGKEVVADAIHALSERCNQPIVKISCAAIPDALLESELLGYERGAFTGAATAKPGKFEMADGGTLFLDEIAEMSTPLQAKLLRIVQDGRCQRLGSTKDVQTNVRILSATHADLRRAIDENKFRSDLYFRLNVILIRLPSLRERIEDIPVLANYFLIKHATRMRKLVPEISSEAIHQLGTHSWPGNVRELENTIQRALAVTTTNTIESLQLDLPSATIPLAPAQPGPSLPIPIGTMTFDEMKNLIFNETLRHCGGNKAKAAATLGVAERTLYRHLPDPTE